MVQFQFGDVFKEFEKESNGDSPHEQRNLKSVEGSCNHPRRSTKEIPVADSNSRKRKHSVTNTDDSSEKPNTDSVFQSKKHIPHELIGLMYQLDLSVLCSIRKSTHEQEYPSLSLAFKDSQIDKFNTVVISDEGKHIYVQVEHVDNYVDSNINYAKLFNDKHRRFCINTYFNSYVKYLISKSEGSSNVKYLIVYTNSSFDLTKINELKGKRSRNFYPFKFCSIDMEEQDILKNLLSTRNNSQGHGFYQFSRDVETRNELFERLKYSPAVKKMIEEKDLSQGFVKKMKKKFANEMVFAVDQPDRERLNSILRSEIKNTDDCKALRERILNNFSTSEKHKQGIVYELNLLTSFLLALYLRKNMFSVNFDGKGIIINYRDRITYVKAYLTNNSTIDYRQLFVYKRDTFFINTQFNLFVEGLDNNIRYFIIYTNAKIDLTEENLLKKGHSKNVSSVKLNSIDTTKKKYKILKSCSCLNQKNLYQFALDSEVLNLLELPRSLRIEKEEGRLSDENERAMKEEFLDKLILAVDQTNEIDLSDVPFNYEELQETTMRWLESCESSPITKNVMDKILKDVENNRFSCEKNSKKDIDEEMKFAKSIIGNEDTSGFDQLLQFLIEGKELQVLKVQGIKLIHISNILTNAGAMAVEAFKDLFNLMFDEEGNKTKYLTILEKERINLSNVSSILNKSGANSARAFKDLYDVWFDEEGNKTLCLGTLKEKGISLVNIFNILSGAGTEAGKSFKDLFDVWFDEKGNKKACLKRLEKEKLNLRIMSSILHGAGARGSQVFTILYDLWFDEEGNKTQYLTNLEQEGVNLSNMTSILSGTGVNAAKVFKNLYDCWFDEDGDKKKCLLKLEREGINLPMVFSILHGMGDNSVQGFTNLYNIWFDERGKKTQCLRVLEEEGIHLSNIFKILIGAGSNAPKAFKELYDLWFDEEGNKTQYLKNLEQEEINLINISNILIGAGANAGKAFKNLYEVWFDNEGNKSQYLINLEEEGINLSNVSDILYSAGNDSIKAFKKLYDLWFDEDGNKTQYLITLENEGIDLSNMLSILNGAGAKASEAFKDLYNTFIDKEGNKTRRLSSFIEKQDGQKSFKLSNLSEILVKTGSNGKDTFEEFYDVCFNEKGEKTSLLDDFYKAGFKPSHLSSLLCGTGIRAPEVLKKLHNLCFDKERNKSKVLNDFCEAGFKMSHLSKLLNGAPDDLKKLHHFCFIGKSRKYLSRFLNKKEDFKQSNLCKILHGAKTDVCLALKDFHDVCFDEKGNKSTILSDFHKAGFGQEVLSIILSMAGNNASSILQNFHNLCFNENNYLHHFLSVDKLLTPIHLSQILEGTGTDVCLIFKKLHDLCFDEVGNKTNYLEDLMNDYQTDEVHDILYESVRKAPPTVSGRESQLVVKREIVSL